MRIVCAIIGGIVGFGVCGAGFEFLIYLAMTASSTPDIARHPIAANMVAMGPLVGLLGLGLGVWVALWIVRHSRSKR
jgi:hypothetical protein